MNTVEKYFNQFPSFFINRGFKDVKSINDFIKPSEEWLNNPFNFDSMDRAVSEILSNPKKTPIFIHGDCDADGVSACSVLYHYLKKIGFKVFYHIPNKSNEGHSISFKTIDYAVSIGCKLMITCDIGMSCFEEIKYAKNNNLRTIVTDHHKPIDEMPDAIAIINPWTEKNSNLFFKEYSGSAVAFKLCHAINMELSLDFDYIYELMGLASIGIVSDKVTMINENRYISYYGFNMLLKGENPGISLLSKRLFPYLGGIDIHKIIRVINMTTKLEDSNLAVKLLTTSIPSQINSYINIIIKKFKKNQKIFNNIIASSTRQVYSQDYNNNNCIFIVTDFDSAYNGAVANSLSNKFHIPSIVISKISNSSNYKGSCRGVNNINNINLFSFLRSNKNILITLGGHPMAAGFTINETNIKHIKESFFNYMKDKKSDIKSDSARVIDGILELNDINLELINFFKKFMPYSTGNSYPIFISKGISIADKPSIIGKAKESIRLKVEQNGITFDSIGIGLINEFEKLVTENKLNIEYTIANNKKYITLNILGVS